MGEAESNEEANQGQMFKREDVKKLQLTLQTLQNSIICIPTVDQPGKFIFELFRRVEVLLHKIPNTFECVQNNWYAHYIWMENFRLQMEIIKTLLNC